MRSYEVRVKEGEGFLVTYVESDSRGLDELSGLFAGQTMVRVGNLVVAAYAVVSIRELNPPTGVPEYTEGDNTARAYMDPIIGVKNAI